MRKIDLQLLAAAAEETAQTDEAGQEANQQAEHTDEGAQKKEKTYSQTEVDKLVAIQKAKLPDKEKMTAYEAWLAEQKKDEPKNPEADEARKALADAQAKLTAYENRDAAIKAGIDVKYADFAVFEVSKLVNDDTDFATELANWLKTNEHYKTGATTSTAGGNGTEGMRHGSATPKTSGVEEAFKRLNPTLEIE